MQGLLINAREMCIEPVFISKIDNTFDRQINEMIGCESHINSISQDGTWQIFMDKDCLQNENNIAFFTSFTPRPLFGNVILIGRNSKTGDRTSLPETVDVLSIEVEFCTKEQTHFIRKESLHFAQSLQTKS